MHRGEGGYATFFCECPLGVDSGLWKVSVSDGPGRIVVGRTPGWGGRLSKTAQKHPVLLGESR